MNEFYLEWPMTLDKEWRTYSNKLIMTRSTAFDRKFHCLRTWSCIFSLSADALNTSINFISSSCCSCYLSVGTILPISPKRFEETSPDHRRQILLSSTIRMTLNFETSSEFVFYLYLHFGFD